MNLIEQTVIKSLMETHKAPALSAEDWAVIGTDINIAFKLGFAYGRSGYEKAKFEKKAKKK